MKEGPLSVVAYLFILFGFLSIILSIIGLKLRFLSFLDAGGEGLGFIIKICFIVFGFILMYVVRTSSEQ